MINYVHLSLLLMQS